MSSCYHSLIHAAFGVFSTGLILGGEAAAPPSLETLLPNYAYERKADHPYIFSRAQFKYRLNADDHLNRYVDRPLFLSPAHNDYEKHFEHAVELSRQYGLDGLAFFPANGFAKETYSFARKQPESFRLLTEIYPSKDQMAHLAVAVHLPQSMRLGGKLLISSYSASSVKVQGWHKLVQQIRKQFPDQTLVIPDLTNFGGIPLSTWITRFNSQSITAADIEKAKEDIRYWLRSSDGVYYSGGEILRKDDRTYHREFYEKVIIRLFKSVLQEEEFKEKHLGLVANLGHENHTRMGRTLSSDGTRALRYSLETALAANPDYINLPEWDELNESTCLMPTVFDGRSTMRLVRYYTAKARGTAPQPIAGDDVAIPNLILSYRKLLVTGEALSFELLNVPDSSGSGEYSASLILKDQAGKEVYRSEVFTFQRDELQEHRVTLPSEGLLDYQMLLPELEVSEGKENHRYAEGLQAVRLRATWNWDYKWVKQSLRDLLKVKEIEFSLNPSVRADTLKAVASIKAEEPLAVFELLENDNPIYIHAKEQGDRWRDSEERTVLSIAWKSEQGFGKPMKLTGSVALTGAEGEWLRMSHPDENGVDAEAIQGQTLVLDGQRSSIWQRRVLLAIAADQVDKAVLTITLQGEEPRELAVSELLKLGAYGVAGKESVNLVVSRFGRQLQFPEALGDKEAKFDIEVWPEAQTALYQVRAVGISGRIYRSKPISLLKETEGKGEIAFFSESTGEPGRAKVADNRILDLRYQFTPKHGDLLATAAGRAFWGVLGGFSTLVTERGASPGDGSSFMGDAFASTAFVGKESAPQWVKLEGKSYALEFNGEASYVTLPQGVISRRGGYTVEMEIRPEEKEGLQPLIANYASRFGTLAVYLKEGELQADFLPDLQNLQLIAVKGIASGIKIPSGEWSKVEVSYDQGKLTLSARGEKFSVPLRGPGAHDVVSSLGYYQRHWYKGQMKSLRVQHRVLE